MFTQGDLELVCSKAFGQRGMDTAQLFGQYNQNYFDNTVPVVPVLFVPVAPYGHWIGLAGRVYVFLLASLSWEEVRCVLLHEMVHIALQEQGRDPSHNGKPWADEVQRLTKLIWGIETSIVRDRVTKVKCDDRWVSVRKHAAGDPANGVMARKHLARWPHALHLVPPDLV